MTTKGRANYYRLTNRSGGTVTFGQIVIVDTANDLSFTTTTTSPAYTIIGTVWDASILDDAVGLIQVHGQIVPTVATSAAVTRGHYIQHGTTAGKVITTGVAAGAGVPPPVGSIGVALTGIGAAGNISAFIFSGVTGVANFTELGDVPSSYTGEEGKFPVVNAAESALEFFPADFMGEEGKIIVVTATEDGFELFPSSFSGEEGKVLTVNATEDGFELLTPEAASGDGSGYAQLRPVSPNTMDDEYDDSTNMSGPVNGIDAKWTARGGAVTVSWLADSWVHTLGTGATFGYDQPRPVTQDYTVALRFGSGGEVGSGNSFGGLYLRDGTNGDMYTFHLLTGNNNARVFDLEVASWGNSATFLGGAFTSLKSLANAECPIVIRIKYTHSSTGLDFDASYDGGLTWTNIWAIAADGISHTVVGWFHTTSGTGRALKDEMSVDWFRRTA